MKTITVALPAEYAEWLESRVAAGDYPTLDDAVLAAVDWLKTEYDDDEPIEPGSKLHALIMEGIESAERGELVDGEEFMAEWIGRLSEQDTPMATSSDTLSSAP